MFLGFVPVAGTGAIVKSLFFFNFEHTKYGIYLLHYNKQ